MGAISGSRPSDEAASSTASSPSGFDPARSRDLQLALDWALGVLERYEPTDSRAVSDEFVSAAAIACDCANEECREILRAALRAQSEAGE
jgi:hypothetical protein